VLYSIHVLGACPVVDGCVLHVSVCWLAMHMLCMTYMLLMMHMLYVKQLCKLQQLPINGP